MLIKSGKVFIDHGFVDADIDLGETIRRVGRLEGRADFDAAGMYVLPGLVDIHTHGAMGRDFSDGDGRGLQVMADYYAAHGVTSFLATTMTLPEEELCTAMRAIRDFHPRGGARCAGVHLEGPFLSFAHRGAQAADHLHRPDCALFDRLNEASGGQVRLVTVACEEEGAMDFISRVSRSAAVSLGHTSCTYDQAMEAFSRGAGHVTHLFNGMDGLHHRKPGLIAAAMDAEATVELICDGFHIHPAVVRMAHRLWGDRLNLISDSLRCAGMPDGDYTLGGQPITLSGGRATLRGTDTLAGSAISLLDGLQRAVQMGIPLESAVYAASTAPAKAAGLRATGALQEGFHGDITVLDRNLQLKAVFIGGRRVK